MVTVARKYVLIKSFKGKPKKSDYKIVKFEIPPLEDQQILVKVEWISVDPYQRQFKKDFKLPYDQVGYQVGIVQKSRNKNYPVGTRVVSHHGWCTHCVMNPDQVLVSPNFGIPHTVANKLPDGLKGLPPSLAIGAVGFSGAAAYFGLLEICKPRKGNTLVVTTAAGCVGSIVGQVAKIKGCKVIGFTGTDDKAQWLWRELGFDYAFNYKTVDVTSALDEAAPYGIDCFFDNVGGELSYAIMKRMKRYGRVAVCGVISAHDQIPNKIFHQSVLQQTILLKQLKVQGFLAFQWHIRWNEAFDNLTKWIRSGQLKVKEHVTEGFDNVVDALVGVLEGQNYGKAVVKV